MKNNEVKLEKGSYGTASLFLGIIGLFLFPLALSTLAIIFGAVGIGKKQRYAKAGLILGIIGVVFAIILIVFFMSLFMAMLGSF